MYTRSYFQDDEKISIPENYDGNAFREDSEAKMNESEKQRNAFTQVNNESSEECFFNERKDNGGLGFIQSFLHRLQPSSVFEKFDFFRGGRFDFGSEEILIFGIALFLFFSEGKDIECALMLLLLLFIK